MPFALFRRPPDPPAIDVVFDATTYQVRLNRKRQARRYTLRIHAADREVVLTIPLRGSLTDAKAFAQRNGAWIATRLRRLPAAAPFVDGALSFSWRLILAPPHVLDYLAAHEVAHLVEMSHAPRFWRIVRRICPDMDRAKAWLDAHGAELHRYGSD